MAFDYARSLNQEVSEFDKQIHDRLNGVARDESDPLTASPETVRKWHDAFDAEGREIQIARQGADVFLSRHPEFKDTTANGQLIAKHCQVVYGVEHPTEEMLEAQYPKMVARGMLDLDQNVLKKQADERTAQQARDREVLSEQEQYEFDLTDIRMVGEGIITAGEARKRHIVRMRGERV